MPHLSIPDGDLAAQNAHYEACCAAGALYVLCLRRRTKANVEFDYITLDKASSAVLEANEMEILDRAEAIYRKHYARGASCDFKATVMFFRDLPVEAAERVAAELFDMLSEVINRPDNA